VKASRHANSSAPAEQPVIRDGFTRQADTTSTTAPANTPPGRYQPPDSLLAFLEALTFLIRS
jgi:hypothetical protein